MDTKPTTSDRDIAYANKMLMSLAKTTSESSSQFSFRMLVGFAAILGALLANIESASAFLSKGTLWLLAILFSIVSLLNLIQSYIATGVKAGYKGAKFVENQPPEDINFEGLLVEIENATLWPMRNRLRKINRRILDGDHLFGGRRMARNAQIGSYLVFLQGIITIIAILILAYGLLAIQNIA
jgi:hypothetical protein